MKEDKPLNNGGITDRDEKERLFELAVKTVGKPQIKLFITCKCRRNAGYPNSKYNHKLTINTWQIRQII